MKRLYFKINPINFLCTLILVITSCQMVTGNNRQQLYPEACDLPCWRGIQLGFTEEQFITYSEENSDQFKDITRHEATDSISYSWIDGRESVFVDAYLKDQIVKYIRILPAESPTLKSIVATFGPPDTYYASLTSNDGYGSLSVGFFYEDLGILADQFIYPYTSVGAENASCQINIPEEFTLNYVFFVEPNSPEVMAEIINQPLFEQPKRWTGFGITDLTSCPYIP